MISSSDRGHETDNVWGRKHKSSCRPPEGKTYLTIGQDFFSIQEYLLSQYNASLHRPGDHHIHTEVGNSFGSAPNILPFNYFNPACTMTYTDIYQLKGLDQPADYGSGIEYAKGLSEIFPRSGLQIGLWLNGDQGCRDVVSGALNDNIFRLFDFIQSELPKSLPKIFLRVGYEFDNPWFGYSDDPEAYKEAFRVIVRACETQMTSNLCHEKVAFVWHSWAAPRKYELSLNQFYPGDYYVDWVGISIFQQLYPWANDSNESEKGGSFAGGNVIEVKEVLEFAKAREKPIMIAESTPFGGMNVTKSSVAKKYIQDDTIINDIWNLWFQKTIDLIDEYDISMWSYINCDWGSQPMWKDIGFGDTRLSSSNVVMDHWWDQVLTNNTRYLLRIDKCDDRSPSDGRQEQDVGRIVPQQPVPTKIGELTMILGFKNDDWGMNVFTLSNHLPYIICTGGLVLMAVLSTRILYRAKLRNRVRSSISQTFVGSSNINCDGVYGSFK